MADLGFNDQNSFKVVHWTYGGVNGSNAYFTLFNHGGPHVDAPNHMGFSGGLDTYKIESFEGPVKVFDFRTLPHRRSITKEMLQSQAILPGDVVFAYTAYAGPKNETDYPDAISLTREAAEYLATIPVRAFGTDAYSVESVTDHTPVQAESQTARTFPLHESFLSR